MHPLRTFVPLLALLGLGACQSDPPKAPLCRLPTGNDLAAAVSQAQSDLASGCASRYDDYFGAFLRIGAGNPDPDNARRFSGFLEWSVDQGLINRRQAQTRYNRYFNVKYMTLGRQYNVCSDTCPRRPEVLAAMRRELGDKKLGLMDILGDRARYQRADRLYQETELVLEATCSACGAR